MSLSNSSGIHIYTRDGSGHPSLDEPGRQSHLNQSLPVSSYSVQGSGGRIHFQIQESAEHKRVDFFAVKNGVIIGLVQAHVMSPGQANLGSSLANRRVADHLNSQTVGFVYIHWTEIHPDYYYGSGRLGQSAGLSGLLTVAVKLLMQQRGIHHLISLNTESPGRYTRAGYRLDAAHSNDSYSLFVL